MSCFAPALILPMGQLHRSAGSNRGCTECQAVAPPEVTPGPRNEGSSVVSMLC